MSLLAVIAMSLMGCATGAPLRASSAAPFPIEAATATLSRHYVRAPQGCEDGGANPLCRAGPLQVTRRGAGFLVTGLCRDAASTQLNLTGETSCAAPFEVELTPAGSHWTVVARRYGVELLNCTQQAHTIWYLSSTSCESRFTGEIVVDRALTRQVQRLLDAQQ